METLQPTSSVLLDNFSSFSLKQAAFYDFYEVSRRNIAILLLFWISYIVAYLLCCKFLRLVPLTTGRSTHYNRRKRSNLSRLMLQSPTASRSHSVQMTSRKRSASRESSSRAASAAEVSETESRTMISDREFKSSAENITTQGIGHHLLSAFSMEFTMAVVAITLVLQGIAMFPVSIAWLKLMSSRASHRDWTSLSLMQQWWQWLNSASYSMLIVGIPMALVIIEAKQYRKKAIIRRLLIVATRLTSPIFQFGLLRVTLILFFSCTGYIVALLLGLVEPWNVTKGVYFINSLLTIALALLSLICIPSGTFSTLRWCIDQLTFAGKAESLRKQKEEVDERIKILEVEIEDTQLGSDSTPISSKSLRSRLTELKLHSADLAEELFLASETLGLKIIRKLFIIAILALITLLTFSIVKAWWTFTFSEILWYFPGIRFIDHLLFKLASTIRLIDENYPQPEYSWYDAVYKANCSTLLSLLFFLGLAKLVRRWKSKTAPFNLRNQIIPIALDHALGYSIIIICTTIMSSPLTMISGVVDDKENMNGDPIGVPPYLPSLGVLLPSMYQALLISFHQVTFLRLPLLVWMVSGYRFALAITVLFIVYRTLRISLQSLVRTLKKRRHSLHPHND